MNNSNPQLKVEYVFVSDLKANEYNPKKFTESALASIKESISKFGFVDPLILNSAPARKNILIGGHARLKVAKELDYKTVPAVYIHIPDIQKEKELNLRLHKNQGEFDFELLAKFDDSFLSAVGFSSQELDEIFEEDSNPEIFDLNKELQKLDIQKVEVKKQDVYEFSDGSRLMCGDSTVEVDVLKLMNGKQADMCFTDEPYLLSYTKGKKRKGKATEGFGYKRDRKYLETDSIPDDFVEKWMANIAKIAKPDFSIIAYENPKNLRMLWNELEKHWTYRNTIIWRIPNRVQGFAAKYKFFNKFDFALLGTSGDVKLNLGDESEELLQNEYEAAIFATSGKPHWQPYQKGSKYCPTDYVEYVASDAKNSGQSVVFGTKPVEIILPYIKVLTKRGDLVAEPFGGAGSTGIS